MVWDSGLGNKCEGDGYGQFKMYGYIYIYRTLLKDMVALKFTLHSCFVWRVVFWGYV